jgi:hypothetical protein
MRVRGNYSSPPEDSPETAFLFLIESQARAEPVCPSPLNCACPEKFKTPPLRNAMRSRPPGRSKPIQRLGHLPSSQRIKIASKGGPPAYLDTVALPGGRISGTVAVRRKKQMTTFTEERTGDWIAACQNPNCGQEFHFQEFKSWHPMAFNISGEPQKPRIGKVLCPHCQLMLPYRPAHFRLEYNPAV